MEERPIAFDGLTQIRVDVDGQDVRWCVASDQVGRALLFRENRPDDPPLALASSGIGAGMAHLRGLESGFGCEVYLMQAGRVNVYDQAGRWLRSHDMHQASEGIHHIEPDGTPVSEDETRGPVDLSGVWQWRIDRHDGCTLGQCDSPDGLALYRNADGLSDVRRPDSSPILTEQSSYFGVSRTGELWIAAPGHDTPEAHQVQLESRVKPAPGPGPVPEPTPPVEPPMPVPFPTPPVEQVPTPNPEPGPEQLPPPKPETRWQRILRWIEKNWIEAP